MIPPEQKQQLIEQLRKTPIVQIACEKSGMARATYYRWRKDDLEFSKATDEALFAGSQLVNDIAESQLLSLIKEKNLTSIIFWLKHRHPEYGNKVEVTARIKQEIEELTDEQKLVVDEALKLSALEKST